MDSNTIYEKAYAKLNISLDVGEKRPDGFHDMTMIMQTVSVYDEVMLGVHPGNGNIRCTMNVPYIATDMRNLAVKAASVYLEAQNCHDKDISISIKKVIPTGAGMAGGSADAAAVLRAMNKLYDNPLDSVKMLELCSKIGSDVAFCYLGGTCLAEGRGEKLTPISAFPDCYFVIAKPKFAISTPEFFSKLDKLPEKKRLHPNSVEIINSIEAGDIVGVCRRMYNVFESIDDRRLKIVSEIKNTMINNGALGSIMTGTGSAVFGIYNDVELAKKTEKIMSEQYSFSVISTPIGSLV